MTDVRLAIVGSTQFARDGEATEWARGVIRAAIVYYEPEVVISGGADGIDTVTREVAAEYGYTRDNGRFIEHLPAVKRWADGYRPRNLKIAQDCTHLLRLHHPASKTYGSGWTADRADDLGKPVIYRAYVPAPNRHEAARSES